jgi:undecaprenyl-diphosphatase
MIGGKDMDLNWLECLVLGLVSGITDVLPVSAQAHRALFLKIFGEYREPVLLRLAIHLAVLGTLYYCCSNHIRRIFRQIQLNRIPKKKRKRPVDSKVIAEFKVLRVMVIPVILSLFLYSKTSGWNMKLNVTALFLLLNGLVLYLPRLMPTGNKDGLSMSMFDSLLMGLGGGLGALPGVSAVGGMLSVASVCGSERLFALNLAYVTNIVLTAGLVVLDILEIVATKVVINMSILISCGVAALAAAVGTYFGMRVMRVLAANEGFGFFAFYSFGCALLSFVFYLLY